MDLLTARSRCIFFVMSTNPIQVLKQTELLGHQFTAYGTAENPLFLTKEVADIIEYSASNSSKLTNLVDRDEKVRNIITTPGGNQEVWLLTEDGLYEALFQSRKPIAKEFKKGVKEILKTIRKTGGYIATKQDDTPEEIMARALIVAQETIKRKEERLCAAGTGHCGACGKCSAQPCNDFPDFDGSCNRTVRNLCGLWRIGYI